MLTPLASAVVAYGLTFQQLVGALVILLGTLFIASVVLEGLQVGRWVLKMRDNLPPAWLRSSMGAMLILAGLAVAFLPVGVGPAPGPSVVSTASSTSTTPSAGATHLAVVPTATLANVTYLMTLRPSAGAQPQKGAEIINYTTYQQSIWYTSVQATSDTYQITSTYPLDGSYHQFEAFVGMADDVEAECGSGVQFAVLLDGTQAALHPWNPGQGAYDLLVNVSGAHQLVLKMDLQYRCGSPVWGNAQLS